MPTYQLVSTTGKTKLLGTFPDLDAVHKLTVFKFNPHLRQYIQEVTTKPLSLTKTTRKPRQSNRWRILFTTAYSDLLSTRTRAEAEEFMRTTLLPETQKAAKLIHVPTYAYHESDD